jgi:CO dehydrogenase/acetyl-CoA synthase beta subunit
MMHANCGHFVHLIFLIYQQMSLRGAGSAACKLQPKAPARNMSGGESIEEETGEYMKCAVTLMVVPGLNRVRRLHLRQPHAPSRGKARLRVPEDTI